MRAEDRDEYLAENIFWVPREARWGRLKGRARQSDIGQVVDDAMTAVERENPSLHEVPAEGNMPARPWTSNALARSSTMIGNIRVGDEEAPFPGCFLAACTSIFCRSLQVQRARKGGRILYATLCRPVVGGDAGAVPGAGL